MPDRFTLRALQETTELVIGTSLHKQNFRRLVEKSGFVEATGETSRRAAVRLNYSASVWQSRRPTAGRIAGLGRKTGRTFSASAETHLHCFSAPLTHIIR